MFPVAAEPLAEADGTRFGLARALQSGLDEGLRQADLGGHAKTLVDGAPLGDEAGVLPADEPAPRRVVENRPDLVLQQAGDVLAPVLEMSRQFMAIQQMRER